MTKVLLVEDDQFIGDVTSQKLVKAGFEVVLAVTGAMALDKISAEQPDVLLLDLDIPDISGVDILKQVKESGSMPVIIFSNNDNPETRAAVEELGADDFFVKASTDLSTITARINELTQ